ncbi:MAG: putative quinol monooxygenase [Pseudonocardiaceae bacterium]
MIFIVVKFTVLPEYQDNWLSMTKDFTESTRAEPGNLWYEWSRNVDNPAEYVLVEAFRDAQAGADHVAVDHFRKGMESMRPALAETPRIINTEIPGAEWSRMGELEIAE